MLVGIWILNVLMAILVIFIFKELGGLSNSLVSPGVGVFVAGIGVIAGIVATVQLHRAGVPVPPTMQRGIDAVRTRTKELGAGGSGPTSPRSPRPPAGTAPSQPPQPTPRPAPPPPPSVGQASPPRLGQRPVASTTPPELVKRRPPASLPIPEPPAAPVSAGASRTGLRLRSPAPLPQGRGRSPAPPASQAPAVAPEPETEVEVVLHTKDRVTPSRPTQDSATYCSSCGHGVAPTQRFCTVCGTPQPVDG